MIGVKKRKDETVESLLKRFNSKVYNSGILIQHMENRFFTKPSTKRRKAKKRAKFLQKIKTRNSY